MKTSSRYRQEIGGCQWGRELGVGEMGEEAQLQMVDGN